MVGRIFDFLKIDEKLGKISKIRPTTARKMLIYTICKKFMQIDNDLRVQTLDSVTHVEILKLLSSQAVYMVLIGYSQE